VRGTIVTTAKGSVRPFTGAEYLESVRDGREIYIYGERVTDVTTHRAFRNREDAREVVRRLARLCPSGRHHDPDGYRDRERAV
jgi:4-hydroxyphenylacetate 3-hydroxylase N terminal